MVCGCSSVHVSWNVSCLEVREPLFILLHQSLLVMGHPGVTFRPSSSLYTAWAALVTLGKPPRKARAQAFRKLSRQKLEASAWKCTERMEMADLGGQQQCSPSQETGRQISGQMVASSGAKARLLLSQSSHNILGEQQLAQYQSVGTSPSLNIKHPGSQCLKPVSPVNLLAGVI